MIMIFRPLIYGKVKKSYSKVLCHIVISIKEGTIKTIYIAESQLNKKQPQLLAVLPQ